MRLFSPAALGVAATAIPMALAYGGHEQQRPLQVYLHPTPSSPNHLSSVPTLSADQAKAVLAHHLGEGIADFEEVPEDEGLWRHLISMWDGATSHGYGSGHRDAKARVIIIDGGVSPQDVLPTSISSSPSFYLSDSDSTEFLLQPYLNRASEFLENILEALPALAKGFKDVFEMAGTKAAAALGHELSCFTALADSIPWFDRSSHSYPWEAITISGLKGVQKDGQVWETGRQGVKAGLESMMTPDSPPLLLIIRPDSSLPLSKRVFAESLSGQAALAATCYASNDTCASATSCNGRGSCQLKSGSGDNECWGCKCASGFAGVECQKTDYSVPFIILVFSTIFLVILVVGAVTLLMSVGDTKLPSTLNLAIGVNMKRD